MIPDELKRMKPMQGKDRLGAIRDSDYMGAEDIEPGTEPVLTIANLYYGNITLSRGKESHYVLSFAEENVPGIACVRPLVMNRTNIKTIRKIYHDMTAENLKGKRIQLYLEPNVRDPSTGDKVDGIRIRSRVPSAPSTAPILCEDCGTAISAVGTYSAADIARINKNRFGMVLCAECSKKRQDGKGKAVRTEAAKAATDQESPDQNSIAPTEPANNEPNVSDLLNAALNDD